MYAVERLYTVDRLIYRLNLGYLDNKLRSLPFTFHVVLMMPFEIYVCFIRGRCVCVCVCVDVCARLWMHIPTHA